MCFVCDGIAPRCNWTYGNSFESICYGTADCQSSADIADMNWELYFELNPVAHGSALLQPNEDERKPAEPLERTSTQGRNALS